MVQHVLKNREGLKARREPRNSSEGGSYRDFKSRV